MKRSLLAVGMVAAMLLVGSNASAAEVQLTWQNCLGDGGVSNRTFACLSNTGTNVLVAAVVLDSDMHEVVSDEVVVDLIATTQPVLPDWWALRNNPPIGYVACRNPAISIAAFDGASCPDIFGLQGSMNIAAFQPDRVVPGSARILCVNAVPITSPVELILADNPAGNGTWAIAQWAINNTKSVGTGACAGCDVPVCIVFNSVNVTVVGNVANRLTSGGPNDRVTFQGVGADCQLVPAKNATWGQVKSLYR